MGNAHCTPREAAWTDPGEVKAVYSSSAQTFESCGPEKNVVPQSAFLKVHIEDRPQRCLVDSQHVVDALVEQSLELIRRDNDDASLFSGLSSSSDEEPALSEPPSLSRKIVSIPVSDTTVSRRAYARSDVQLSTVTATTSESNETQQVGNRWYASEMRNHRHGRRQTHGGGNATTRSTSRSLGTVWEDDSHMQEELTQAITKVSKKESEIRRLGRLVKSIESGEGCAAIPASLVQDPLPAHLGPLAREYMTILHLRIQPRFVDFFQSHLARMAPQSLLTRAVTRGIALDRMSPPRKFNPMIENSRNRTSPLVRAPSNTIGSNAEGALPPSGPICLLATGSAFADLGITGSLGLVDRWRTQRPASLSMTTTGRVKPPKEFTVLMNRRTGVPVAVCALKTATTGPPVVRVYATKRRLYGQRPVATTQALGLDWCAPHALFPWAEIVTEGRYPHRVQYSIFMASGNGGRFEDSPSYRAEHTSEGSPVIRIVGRTERESKHSGCAVLTLCREEGTIEEDDLFLDLSVAKGVDPALFLCFAAFVDEAMEKTMRQHYATLSSAATRR